MLCIETRTSFDSLQRSEGAAGEFNGALTAPGDPLISSPVFKQFPTEIFYSIFCTAKLVWPAKDMHCLEVTSANIMYVLICSVSQAFFVSLYA